MFLNKGTIYKLMAQIRSAFAKTKQERKLLRQELLNQYIDNAVKKAKWGISYSVFDGEELLEPSIRNLREHVDYINAVYQTENWTGEYKNPDVIKTVQKLKDMGLIDEIIEFKPNTKLLPVKNQTAKRNLGLSRAKKAGCDYFMTIDVDEFYEKDALIRVKKEIIEKGITHAYCPIINYGTLPTRLSKESPAFFAVPIFSKVGLFTKLGPRKKSIAVVDPTRNMSDCMGAKYFFFCDIAMHHMAFVRNNLFLKLKSSSNKNTNNSRIEEIKKKDGNCVDVEDKFNIMPYLSFPENNNEE